MSLLTNTLEVTNADMIAGMPDSMSILITEGMSFKSIPIISMLEYGKKGPKCPDTLINWNEFVRKDVRLVNITASLTTSTTSVTVDDATYVSEGQLFMTHSGEIIYVSAVNYGTKTLTITRGYAGTTEAAANHSNAAQKELMSLGTVFAEGTGLVYGGTEHPDIYFNMTQIFKRGYGLTGSAAASTNLGMNSEASQMARAMMLLQKDREQAILFGQPNGTMSFDGKAGFHHYDTQTRSVNSQNQPERTMGGVEYWLGRGGTTNTLSTSTMSYTTFCDDILTPMKKRGDLNGKESRVWIGGTVAYQAIRAWSRKEGKEYLLEKIGNPLDWPMYKLTNDIMDITFMYHPMMDSVRYKNTNFFIHPDSLVLRPYREETLTSGPDVDANSETHLIEESIEFHGAHTGLILKNFTGAA